MPELQRMKFDLINFHKIADDASPGEKLDLLRQMQKNEYVFKNRTSLQERRKRFNNNKRLWRFFKRRCYVCIDKSEVRHHVISLKQGGFQSAKRNIVALCKRCHAEIHPWLKQ